MIINMVNEKFNFRFPLQKAPSIGCFFCWRLQNRYFFVFSPMDFYVIDELYRPFHRLR